MTGPMGRFSFYEVIQTKDTSGQARPFKCVLRDRELWGRKEINVGQIRLLWRPKEDREKCRQGRIKKGRITAATTRRYQPHSGGMGDGR